MDNHFKLFFTCPACDKAIIPKEDLADYYASGARYCGHCGHSLASICEELLASDGAEEQS